MDKLIKTLIYNDELSLTVIKATDIVNEAIRLHHLTPLAAAALGRTLVVGCFMASSLKNNDDSLSITIKGDGVGGTIVVAADSYLHVRGLIDNPDADLPLKANGKLDVGGCVGRGRISVVKNMGLKTPYTGSSEIVSGEIAEDFSEYYMESEQTPTALALGVKIGVTRTCVGAGGIIIQALPNASEESLNKAEEIMKQLTAVSTLMENMEAEEVLEKYFGKCKEEVRIPEYKCSCNEEYIESVLVALGEKELKDILKEKGKVELVCHFCEKKYEYDEEQINALLVKAK